MAKITMDSSEWEEMKKNAKLLEEAVAREKKLGARVEELQQANIDALKANEKMVTIHKKVTISETIQVKVSTHDIINRLFRAVAEQFNETQGSNFDRGMRSRLSEGRMGANDVEQAFYRTRHHHGHQWLEHEVDDLRSLFFTQKHELNDAPERDEITHKGLDQVKADIAQEYAENMSEKDKRMHQDNQDFITEVNVHKAKIKDQKIMMKNNDKIISNLEKDVKNLSENADLQNERLDALRGSEKKLNLIGKSLKRKRGILRNPDILRTLDTILQWQTKD